MLPPCSSLLAACVCLDRTHLVCKLKTQKFVDKSVYTQEQKQPQQDLPVSASASAPGPACASA